MNAIDTYLEDGEAQIAGRLGGKQTHTEALVALIRMVKDQQSRIAALEAKLIRE